MTWETVLEWIGLAVALVIVLAIGAYLGYLGNGK